MVPLPLKGKVFRYDANPVSNQTGPSTAALHGAAVPLPGSPGRLFDCGAGPENFSTLYKGRKKWYTLS